MKLPMRHEGVDTSEFVEFYTAQKDRCLRAVVASGMEQDRAEEAVAEAFASAWSRWRTVRTMESPAAWVVRTAINHNISWWRKRHREVLSATSLEQPVIEESGRVDLVAAIRKLPPRQREVVIFRYLLDLDTQSTARTMGIATGTVSAHLHQALASLRGLLAISERTFL